MARKDNKEALASCQEYAERLEDTIKLINFILDSFIDGTHTEESALIGIAVIANDTPKERRRSLAIAQKLIGARMISKKC